jgi:hypothetical protein
LSATHRPRPFAQFSSFWQNRASSFNLDCLMSNAAAVYELKRLLAPVPGFAWPMRAWNTAVLTQTAELYTRIESYERDDFVDEVIAALSSVQYALPPSSLVAGDPLHRTYADLRGHSRASLKVAADFAHASPVALLSSLPRHYGLVDAIIKKRPVWNPGGTTLL